MFRFKERSKCFASKMKEICTKQKKRNKKDEPIFKTKEIPDNKKRLSKNQQETQSMLTSLD